MKIIRTIEVEKKEYLVTISDDTMALQAAFAAGGAMIGIIDSGDPYKSLQPAQYAVEDVKDIDDEMLERVVRRRYGMSWNILETEHLFVREFTVEDAISPEPVDGDRFCVFSSKEGLKAYVENQYPFYGCGIWALVDKKTGQIIGKAGIEGEELGYHIYKEYRRKGYAREACRGIIQYAKENMGMQRLYLRTKRNNKASIALASSLGFQCAGGGLENNCKDRAPGGESVCFFELNPI